MSCVLENRAIKIQSVSLDDYVEITIHFFILSFDKLYCNKCYFNHEKSSGRFTTGDRATMTAANEEQIR